MSGSCPEIPPYILEGLPKYAEFKGAGISGYKGVIAFRMRPWDTDETSAQFCADPLSNYWESPVSFKSSDSSYVTLSCAGAVFGALASPFPASSWSEMTPSAASARVLKYTRTVRNYDALQAAIRAKYNKESLLWEYLKETKGMYLLCVDVAEVPDEILAYSPNRYKGQNLLGLMLMKWRDTPSANFVDESETLPRIMYDSIAGAELLHILSAPYIPTRVHTGELSPTSSDDASAGAASVASGLSPGVAGAMPAPVVSTFTSSSPMSPPSLAGASSSSAGESTSPGGLVAGGEYVEFKDHERSAIDEFPLVYDRITKIECSGGQVTAFYCNLRKGKRLDDVDYKYRAPFFGNFWPAIVSVQVYGITRTFKNAEAAFQALKIDKRKCSPEYESIIQAFERADGEEAWKLRETYKKYAGDWRNDHLTYTKEGHIRGQREFIMYTVLTAKFTPKNDLGRILKETGDDILVEYKPNVTKDRTEPYWHTDDIIRDDKADGNALGLFLMIRRAELRGETAKLTELKQKQVMRDGWKKKLAMYVQCIKSTLSTGGELS
jgi:predicted NAD-dependent protein-ADP-ribosyltransferase YbiA (DUF1768 family)